MKNKLFSVAIFCASVVVSVAQEAIKKVPKDAAVVGTVKGQNLLELISMDDLNQSFIGQSVLKKLKRKNQGDYKSLEDLGLNLNATTHYFYEVTDSISYNNIIIPIKDVSKFEQFVRKADKGDIINKDGINTIVDEKSEGFVWNNDFLVIVNGNLFDSYFEDEAVMAQYGLEAAPDNYGYYTEDPQAEIIEEATDAQEAGEVEEHIEEDSIEIVEEADQEDEYYDNNDDYYSYYYKNSNIKNALKSEWEYQHALTVINLPASESVIHAKDYRAGIDPNAEASLWVRNFSMLYNNLFGGLYYSIVSDFNIDALHDGSSLVAHIYTEEKEMKLSVTYTVNDQMAKSYKKISSKKLNKKFLKYIDEDRMVGFMGYAMDTKAALQEYPVMLKSMYANMPMYGEEASLIVDIFELLIDEEAIAKVIPGDMVFLLSGISKKEMTYTSYEYDEDYEYTEVEKTREETVPDFLFMMSTEDAMFINKIIDYGLKKNAVTYDNKLFSMRMPDSPLDVHFLIKDGILFMGTSKEEMGTIANGKTKTSLSKKYKKLLVNSNYSLFLNGKQFANRIPTDNLSKHERSKIDYLLNNATNAYISSSKIKGNKILAEMVVEVPENEENSLKYLINIMNTLSQ